MTAIPKKTPLELLKEGLLQMAEAREGRDIRAPFMNSPTTTMWHEAIDIIEAAFDSVPDAEALVRELFAKSAVDLDDQIIRIKKAGYFGFAIWAVNYNDGRQMKMACLVDEKTGDPDFTTNNWNWEESADKAVFDVTAKAERLKEEKERSNG